MYATKLIATLVIALGAAIGGPVAAANVEVKMLNKGETGSMVFEPALVRVAPGDTVTFVATDKSHNAETIPGMLPEGAEAFKGEMSKDVSVTFTEAGAYGIKCGPHLGMGMVALVVVGDEPVDAEALHAVKLPKKAHERLEDILEELE
ncbi:MAG TPA: pseudoazurin [Devosia sp.]|nr:pseudoazurin [Devosia sp.]